MWTLRRKLLGGVALVIVILIAIMTFISANGRAFDLTQNINRELRSITDSSARNLAYWVESNKLLLSGLISEYTPDREVQMLEQALASTTANAAYYAIAETKEFLLRPQFDLPPGFDPTVRPWYLQAANAREAVITPPYRDASSGELTVTFAAPVINGGQIAAVAGIDKTLNYVVEQVLTVDLPANGYSMLVDENNVILAHQREDQLDQVISDVMSPITGSFASAEDGVIEVQYLGAEYLLKIMPIAGTSWRLAIALDRQEALAEPVQRAVNQMLLVGLIVMVVALVVAYFVIQQLLRPLSVLAEAMDNASQADGDLTRRLPVKGKDELSSLASSFNRFAGSVQQLVMQSKLTAVELIGIAQQIESSALENNEQVQSQKQEILQVAAALHQMSSTSAEVADFASSTAESSQRSADATDKANHQALANGESMRRLMGEVDEAGTVIQQLDAEADSIGSILNTIQEIAEQTNLLALNAAIEAARAGDQGRGFAVVADEVRALSQRTHEATEEIQKKIQSLQNQTTKAVSIMDRSKEMADQTADNVRKVAEFLETAANEVREINQMAQRIADAAAQQREANDEIGRITTVVSDSADVIAENVEDNTRQAADMAASAKGLGDQMALLKVE
ncbi:methyl-accepting chemotaxis protein [Salinibius halmophilus]|uniref:methyl-accepting chemotaxis protein n=1 Tax=Salinibius halmophilus TaxID=1853216 RepID=UPI001314363A|nr:methyl-accepting chemotaxis protein [Salinibius halmophilus]